MPLPKIDARFNGAIQKSTQERKITELQVEIEQLRTSQSSELEAQIKNCEISFSNQEKTKLD